MARYASTIVMARSHEDVARSITSYLTSQGFTQVDPAKNVWKKGMGLMLGPQ